MEKRRLPVERRSMEYLEQLNEPQREGVVSIDGPCMIIAGAGSGKTRVLTFRIAHLMKAHEVDPFSILALTFTNKAASEMKKRIEQVVGSDARNLWMGTFHSVFARILRHDAHRIGYPNNFTIYDTDDSKSLIKSIVKEMGLDDKLYKPNGVLSRISGAKNNLVSWEDYLRNPVYREDDEAAMRPEIGRIYKTYQERCFTSGAMDFDDLLFNMHILLRDHDDVRHRYQHRFRYIMVDEFQDTNLTQYIITRTLSKVHQNIAVVGDDAQSIYAFRGANIQNILNFEKDYPELKVIKLEQNYRSTKNIVNAANSIIAKNTAQLPKNVWTDNLEGDLVEIVKTTSDNEEGKIVASQIFEEKNNHQLSYDDFAVLYRTNSQSRAIEEALRRSNIPYVIIGGVSFYQRREIKDLLGYLRFVVNPLDEQAFRRIVNLPKRGVGATSVDKIVNASFDNNRPLWDVVSNVHAYMSGRAANSVASFAEMIGNFRGMTERKDAFEMASHIAKVSGLLRELYEDKTVEGLNRYENVQELLNAIKEYVDNPENEDKSLGAFLQEVALLTDADNKKKQDDGLPKVTLMTIHMAKGLEFKNVFVVGLEEDLFPSQMMLESRADLEEERRLFYVAITRAMNKLFLTYALSRYRFGRLKNCEPSRFLEEIDPAYVRINRRSSSVSPAGMLRRGGSLPGGTNAGSEFQGSNYARNLVRGTQLDKKNSQNARQTNRQVYKPSPGFAPSDTTDLKEGQRVEHAKFGMGTVTKMDTTGANRKASVLFENAGEKTLLLSFAKLRIVE